MRLPFLFCLATTIVACAGAIDDEVGGEPGASLPGLSAAERARFAEGKDLFHHRFTPEEGLGPLFNQRRCSSCHDIPAIGGSGIETVIKATRFEGRACDLLTHEGGDNVQQDATPLLAALGIDREQNPPSATARKRVTSPSLFGLGLIEMVPKEVILEREDPNDADGDGISGRAGRTTDLRIGLFGRKADNATVADFVAGALLFELGLTTPVHPVEEPVNGSPVPKESDPAPDPEIGQDALNLLIDYVRFLAPPAPLVPSAGAERDSVEQGERLFRALGCQSCHVPTMRTGPSDHPAFDRKTIRLYSDMLLHDMGPDMAGICAVSAGPSEYRTARLAGLRFRVSYLNDGRAITIESAILEHGGEAQTARDAYDRLGVQARAYLMKYLGTL